MAVPVEGFLLLELGLLFFDFTTTRSHESWYAVLYMCEMKSCLTIMLLLIDGIKIIKWDSK